MQKNSQERQMMTMYISPYRRLANMRQAMDRMLDETYNDASPAEREMLLALDVQANEEGYTITALVPGLDADDLDLEILKNTVTIRGQFKSTEQENTKYLMSELPSGNFSRSVTLPTDIDASKVEANIKNGMLSLYVPKAEEDKPKTIKVNIV
jgi:HSP20 family protein